jgi:hypothetical protein
MPEVVASLDQQESANRRRLGWGALSALVGLAVALAFYLRLFHKVQGRDDVFAFFLQTMLPAAVIHVVCFLVLTLVFKLRARGNAVFWAISALAVLVFGGWSKAIALVFILLFGCVLARIGLVFGRWLLPRGSSNWGVSLSFALVLLSAGGAFLAWAHLFTWWMLALMLLAALIPDIKTGLAGFGSDARNAWDSFVRGWSFPCALELEALFLLSVFAFVSALAPETNSDAVRFYWPYMRLLRHNSGFFDGPIQWCYIIPQAGLVYGSAVLSLLGQTAVRLSMLLAWSALIGTAWRRFAGSQAGVRGTLIVVLASSPVVLWVASSLMLDTFVCVTVVALAILCVEGREPASARFWIAVGLCAATAWAAKFSTIAYAAPLVAYAALRCYKASGAARTMRGLGLSAGSFIVIVSPWLYHSYQQSGNPVFPFLLKWFPSPLWPRGVGFSNLDTFRLPEGWRGWFLWPIDLTYHASKFVEGYDGKLGLILLMLLAVVILVIWRGSAAGRALGVIAVLATVLLWSQTAYLRYWLPSLWLVIVAASYPMRKPLWPDSLRPAAAAAAFLVMMPQVLFNMVNYWPDSQGWPWRVYAGRISPQSYVGSQFEALSAEIDRSQTLGRGFPKIWFTGYEAIGHLQVQPMEATIWELSLHTLGPRSQIQYLISSGCQFWLVNEDDQDAMWFRAEGISHYFWNESNLVMHSGPLAIYRMPDLETTLRDFDARLASGTELLLNGGFETGKQGMPKFWLTDGDAPELISTSPCLEGNQCMQLRLKSGMRQGIALPPGLGSVELLVSARSSLSGRPTSFRIQVYSLGFEKDPATVGPADQVQPDRGLTGKGAMETADGEWRQFRMEYDIPKFAHFIIVGFDKPEGSGEVLIDAVHLYSRR